MSDRLTLKVEDREFTVCCTGVSTGIQADCFYCGKKSKGYRHLVTVEWIKEGTARLSLVSPRGQAVIGHVKKLLGKERPICKWCYKKLFSPQPNA